MSQQPFSARSSAFVLMMFSAFLCYLALLMPLSSLSIFVTRELGMSNTIAGIVASAAFFVTILFRKSAGDRVNILGGKRCFLRGTLWYVAGGCVCMSAAVEALPAELRLATLLAGRAMLGMGESHCNVAMACWSVDLLGVQNSGRIFATLGMSMYAAAAVGGQLGFHLYQNHGFFMLSLLGTLAPLAAFFLARRGRDAFCPPGYIGKTSFLRTMRQLFRIGFTSLCCAVGFGVVGAFLSKTFVDRGWEYAGLAFSVCGMGFVAIRPFAGHLPDKVGGLPVASVSAAVEVVGLYMLWLARNPEMALLGAFLTGAGVSMVFPSNGSEIAKATAPEVRGTALSCYNIFVDVAYCFAGPVAGYLTDRHGDGAAYLFAALFATLGLSLILNNLRISRARRRR